MRKLLTLILALPMATTASPREGTTEPPVTAEQPPRTAITTKAEEMPD